MKISENPIHHVAIIGSNKEKSLHFYRDVFGFEVIRENYREDRDDWKIDLKLGDSELELFIIKNRPKRPSYPEAYGLRHLAFRTDNIEECVKTLEENGYKCEPIRTDDYTGKKMCFVMDPDELPIELHE